MIAPISAHAIAPSAVLRGEGAWTEALPRLAALCQTPLLLGRSSCTAQQRRQLILDLEERNLLDRTLVVIASEFSRDMIIEGVPGSSARDQSRARTDTLQELKHYGLHRHFTGGTSVVMFGGGVKQGFVYGKTADSRPCLAVENPVPISDMHATIFTAMGINPRTSMDVERRPFYVTEDGEGKAVSALFS